MIVDCCLYSGETEMLELRLRTLADVVDQFVVVTCSLTHQGERVELAMLPGGPGIPVPVVHTVHAEPLPAGQRGGVGTRWYQAVERVHRDGVREACVAANVSGDAVVMVSDVDEIPSVDAVAELDALIDLTEQVTGRHWLVLQQRFHSTALDLLHPQQPWLGTCVSRMAHLHPQEQRDARGDTAKCEWVSDGGWHLSWFGTDEERQRKLDTFSHAELRGKWDPAVGRLYAQHANGEVLQHLTVADLKSLDWPAPLTDGTFEIPAVWLGSADRVTQ